MVSKIPEALAQIKGVSLNWLHSSLLTLNVKRGREEEEEAPLVKNVLDEAEKTMNYMKSQPLNVFNILCNEMGRMYEALLLNIRVKRLP